LLPAHARQQLVREQHLQTTTGFSIQPHGRFDDPRTRVKAVEVGSPAAKADLQPGDLIVSVNGEPNSILMDLSGPSEKVDAVIAQMKGYKEPVKTLPGGRTRVEFTDPASFFESRNALGGAPDVDMAVTDRLEDKVRDWPRGRGKLTLSVEREEGGKSQVVNLSAFTPATVGLYPTQLYETVSMVLLILFLLAYYPFRRHDGQLMTLLMIGYAFHRFVNESLRIEPTIGGGLTLSQWGSVVIFVAAVAMEIYLWRTMPSRWSGEASASPAIAPTPAPQAAPTESKS
jgi:hypothetical protein